MTNRCWNPPDVVPPFGPYSHCAEVRNGARLLYVAGQVGVTADGIVAATVADQCKQAFDNILAILDANDMFAQHIVKFGAFLLDPHAIPTYRKARDAALGAHKPASTLLIVSALADPAWQVEIEAYAACPA